MGKKTRNKDQDESGYSMRPCSPETRKEDSKINKVRQRAAKIRLCEEHTDGQRSARRVAIVGRVFENVFVILVRALLRLVEVIGDLAGHRLGRRPTVRGRERDESADNEGVEETRVCEMVGISELATMGGTEIAWLRSLKRRRSA